MARKSRRLARKDKTPRACHLICSRARGLRLGALVRSVLNVKRARENAAGPQRAGPLCARHENPVKTNGQSATLGE
jgi:hypothetical protein